MKKAIVDRLKVVGRWPGRCWRSVSDWAYSRNLLFTKRELTEQLEASDKAAAGFVRKLHDCAEYESKLRAQVLDLQVRLDIQRGLTESMCDGTTLTPAQVERLAMLAEECGEVIQVCGKILRFGFESCSPFDDKHRPNRILLERELGGLTAVMDLLGDGGDVAKNLSYWRYSKRNQLPKWTKHQGTAIKGANGDGAARG